jgi:hypothetical protein
MSVVDINAMFSFFGCDEKPNRARCEKIVRLSYAAWHTAKSFDNLKRVFHAVALGKMYAPFYSELLSSPDAEDNPDMHRFTDKFAELQMLGFLTDNSQFEESSSEQIQKAYITGYMPVKLAEFVCGMVNRRPDMIAYVRRVHNAPIPPEFSRERTMLGVTFEGDSLRPYTSMNLQASPHVDILGWCPQFNDIILEAQLLYVSLINVNYNAQIGTLLDFTLDTLKEFNKTG